MRDANNYQQEKNTCFYKIIHFPRQLTNLLWKYNLILQLQMI